MRYGLRQVAGPDLEPVTLDEVKTHLRVMDYDEDDLISSLIVAARELVEVGTNRQLVTAQYLMTLDRFPTSRAWDERGAGLRMNAITVPRPNLLSVTAITYIDDAGASATWDPSKYDVDTYAVRGTITPAYGEVYPTTRSQINAVTVSFVAGYGDPAAVPDGLKAAMKLIVGHFYENREQNVAGTIVSDLKLGIQQLIWAHRVEDVA